MPRAGVARGIVASASERLEALCRTSDLARGRVVNLSCYLEANVRDGGEVP